LEAALPTVTKRGDLPGPVMCRGAGLHTDQTGRQSFEPAQQLRTAQLLSHDNRAIGVDAVNLEHRLGEIEADRGSVHADGSCFE
jgi:hypothetical protein